VLLDAAGRRRSPVTMPGYHAGRSPGRERVVFLKPLVSDPRIEVGEYTYYDDPRDPRASSATPSSMPTAPSAC
jgi:hypothetical protein